MKRIIITLSMILVSLTSIAQENNWEAFVGLNNSKLKFAVLDLYDSSFGFQVGLRRQCYLPNIADGVYANAGLLLTQKGGKFTQNDTKTTLYYLEVPVHMGYKLNLQPDFDLFGEAGFYVAYGIGGNHKTMESRYDSKGKKVKDSNGNTIKDEVVYNPYDEFLKRYDAGIGFRVGAEIKKKYTFSIGYDAGLVDVYHHESDDDHNDNTIHIDLATNCKIRNLSFTVGVIF